MASVCFVGCNNKELTYLLIFSVINLKKQLRKIGMGFWEGSAYNPSLILA